MRTGADLEPCCNGGGKRARVLASLWGLAEATLFFIVPDVFLSWRTARHGLVAGLKACLAALLGAVIGGLLLYLYALGNAPIANEVMLQVPAVSQATVDKAHGLVVEHGWLGGMIVGALQGVPYKLFAVHAAETSLPLLDFALLSLPARAVRFLLVTQVIAALAFPLKRSFPAFDLGKPLIGLWLCFYLWFFWVMGF